MDCKPQKLGEQEAKHRRILADIMLNSAKTEIPRTDWNAG